MVELEEMVPSDCELPSRRGTSALRMLRQWATHADNEIRRQRSDIEALRAQLKKANAQAEYFERQWYLRGDEVDQLREELAEKTAHMAEVDPRRVAACLKACDGIATQVLEQGRMSPDAFAQEDSRAERAEIRCEELVTCLNWVVGVLREDTRPEVLQRLPLVQAMLEEAQTQSIEAPEENYSQAVADAYVRLDELLRSKLSAEKYEDYALDLEIVFNQRKAVEPPETAQAAAYLAICSAMERAGLGTFSHYPSTKQISDIASTLVIPPDLYVKFSASH